MSDRSQPPTLAVIAAFAAIYFVWGSNFLAIRYAVETIPPFLLMGSRSLIAGAALVGWALARGAARPSARHWFGAAAAATFLFLVGHGGLAWSQQHVPSWVAALPMATIPIWMVLLEWRLLETPPPPFATWAGLVCGVTGIALLVLPARGEGVPVAPLLPIAVLLMSAFGWASGSIASRLVDLPKSVPLATGAQLLVGGVLLCGLSLAVGELATPLAISLRSAVGMAYMVVMASIVTFTAYVWLLRVSTPARVASYAFVNPAVAVFTGWALGGEPVTPRALVAAAVIVTGVALIVSARTRH